MLSLWVAVFAGDLGAAVVWSGPEGFALFAKVAKFIDCRNGSPCHRFVASALVAIGLNLSYREVS